MNKSIVKIAFIIPSLQAGGMERVMAELANYYSKKKDLEIHFVFYGKSPKLFYTINQNITIHKVKGTFNDSLRLFEALKRMWFIRKTIRAIQPNAVLSFGTQWNNMALLALKNTTFPVFVSDRGSPVRKYKFTTELLKSILYGSAAGIIAQTKTAKEILKERFPKTRITTIGNPINKHTSDKEIKRENLILTIGRLIETKHHDRLIKVFSKLAAPDWKLMIVGGDALKEKNYEKLQLLIKNLGVENRVILTGMQKNIGEYYQKSKIFAFTSSVEGFPNVVGEALSAGLPVVSYDCLAGPSEMITNGDNGFLIPVFDDVKFQEKLQLLINNENLRQKMAEKAPESIKKFCVETIGKQFLDFILAEKIP